MEIAVASFKYAKRLSLALPYPHRALLARLVSTQQKKVVSETRLCLSLSLFLSKAAKLHSPATGQRADH